MAKGTSVPKTGHQLARAHRLADVIVGLPGSPAAQLAFAEALTPADWSGKVAVVADRNSDNASEPVVRFEERPPSPETTQLALTLLRWRLEGAQAEADAGVFVGFPR